MWHEATIGDVSDGWTIWDVVRLRGDGAVAIATGVMDRSALLLRSTDGGRTWHRDATAFERDVEIHDLTRNTGHD